MVWLICDLYSQMGWFPALSEVTASPDLLPSGKTVTLKLPVQGNEPFGVR